MKVLSYGSVEMTSEKKKKTMSKKENENAIVASSFASNLRKVHRNIIYTLVYFLIPPFETWKNEISLGSYGVLNFWSIPLL